MTETAIHNEVATNGWPFRRLALIAVFLVLAIAAIAAFWLKTAGPSSSLHSDPAQPLNLADYYQTAASDFTNGRFPWGEVPRGAKTFGNVPLAIDGMICLWGAANTKLNLEFPKTIDKIAVNRKFETLYVYHAAFFQSPEGSPVYRLTMHYADDTVRESTICYGVHMLDWFQVPNQTVSTLSDPKSQIVWRGDVPNRAPDRPLKLRFSITSIPNPKPSLEVKSISLASAAGNSAGCILALTTGPADLLKVEAEETVSGKK